MNIEEKDKLKSLFQEMKIDTPPPDFENKLMQRIHMVAAKKSRIQSVKSIVAIASGIIGMLGIPIFIFQYLGLSFKTEIRDAGAALSLNMPPDLNPFAISVACVGVLLFISDTLIRRRIQQKKYRH
jgi:hypothetical protein